MKNTTTGSHIKSGISHQQRNNLVTSEGRTCLSLVRQFGPAGLIRNQPPSIHTMSMTPAVVFVCIVLVHLSELIHGSIIRPKVTRDTHAPFKNEVIQNLNLYLIPELDDIRVPDDFSIDTSPDSYQPPADILKLILFNHNRLVKNIALLEKDPSPKETLRLFNKNSTLQNVSLLLSIINK